MAVTYTFAPGLSREKTLDESNLVQHNPILRHTKKGDLRATFQEDRNLDAYAQRQDRLNISLDGTVKWTGFIVGARHDEDRATTEIQGEGVAKRLEETKPSSLPVTYQNIALADAIDDYWGRTPFTNRSVTDESTTTVATDQEVQSADTDSEWNGEVSIASDKPIVVSGGELKQAQTAFTREGEDTTTESGTGANFQAAFSGSSPDDGVGESEEFTGDNESATYDFTTDHDIPASDLEVWLRFEFGSSDATSNPPNMNATLNGNTWEIVNSGDLSLEWRDVANNATTGNSYSGGDLAAGSHTLTLETTSSGGSSPFIRVDVVVPVLDNGDRFGGFSYTFDDTVTTAGDGSNFLDGPEHFPQNQTFETETENVSFNITAVNVTSTWDDTTGNQQIAATLDGSNYLTSDNSTTLDQSFSSQRGRSITVRYTFDRWGSQTNTPGQGFNSQAIDSATVKVDGDDLTVVDDLTLTRNHFDNLQTLHSYGDFIWVIEHDSGSYSNLTVSSFERGDETRPAPSTWDNPENKNAQVQAQLYFNSVYLEGAKDDQGNRPSTTLDDSSEISSAREKIQVFLRDLDVTTDAGATFRARSLLNTATSNNDLVGTISAPPDVIDPGYARSVDLGDGAKDKTVEKVSLSQSNGQLRATYEFTIRQGFAQEISRLKRNTRSLEDQV